MRLKNRAFSCLATASCGLLFVGCTKPAQHIAPTPPTLYSLHVSSINPAGGVAIEVATKDAGKAVVGTTPFHRSYVSGEVVTLSAPEASADGTFDSWTGCASTSAKTCSVTLLADTTVVAHYSPVQLEISPGTARLVIGQNLQFTAKASGVPSSSPSQAVKWSLTAPAGWKGDLGTVTNSTPKASENGLYTTPYPAPELVTLNATSIAYPAVSASVSIALAAPASGRGPDLHVDAGGPGRAINPLIYGMNFFSLDAKAEKDSGMTVDRFGGDGTSLYNYLLDTSNAGDDWFFENSKGKTGQQDDGQFNTQFLADKAAGVKTMATVNVLGWVAKDGTTCSFPTTLYPSQLKLDPYGHYKDKDHRCGDGKTPDDKEIKGNDPTATSISVGPSFTHDWVTYLVGKFGNAASGGVAFYSLDNEPAWWNAVHRDVHPAASTYDEVTQNGIATAEAVKTADPTASVTGPVVDFWWNYFYSKKDIESGWHSDSPCHKAWSNPVDRDAHQGVPFVEWYLQQMKAAESTFGARVLDYLDLHTYYAGSYQGADVGLTTAGDTGEQQVRLDATRAFWDPTYTDSATPQPNYRTDANYTANCSTPLQAPELIPMMQTWIARNYPGTKTATTEYNWGGQENINGAIAQADLLGIFGREGLDLATLWGPPDPVKQTPGLMAFKAFRNYDDKGSQFGDMALPSSSGNQAQLAVYSSRRTSDRAITVIVLNKTYGDLEATLEVQNLVPAGPAKVLRYSNADLSAIVTQPDVTLLYEGHEKARRLTYAYPAQSITIFIVQTK